MSHADLPSLALLLATRGQGVLLGTAAGESVPATLHRAGPGVPMNEDYRCYSAEFLLSPDVQLPQAVYRLQIGERAWPLLMTPVGLGAERRGRLQAVFHARQTVEDRHIEQGSHHE